MGVITLPEINLTMTVSGPGYLGSAVSNSKAYLSAGHSYNATCKTANGEPVLQLYMACDDQLPGPAFNDWQLSKEFQLAPGKRQFRCDCGYITSGIATNWVASLVIFIVSITQNNMPMMVSNNPYSKCPESSPLVLTCNLDKSLVYPTMDLGMIPMPGSLSEPPGVSETSSWKVYNSSIFPDQSGDHNVTCLATIPDLADYKYERTTTVIVYEPPSQKPQMSLNGTALTDEEMKTVDLWDTVVIVCRVDGGHPAVTNVTLDCAGVTNATTTGEATLDVAVNKSVHGQSCVCGYQHVSECDDTLTSSFSFDVRFPSFIASFVTGSGNDQTVEVDAGDSLAYECVAEGSPDSTVTIRKGDSLLEVQGADVQASGQFGQHLRLTKEMTCRDSDTYTCMAGNQLAHDVTATITVLVRCEPELMSITQTLEGSLTSTRLRVSVFPDPSAFKLYRRIPRSWTGNRNRRRRAAEESSRHLIDPSGYSVRFSRTNSQFGEIDLKLLQLDSDDVSFYTMTVLNGLTDQGMDIDFNVTLSELVKTTDEKRDNTQADSRTTILLLAVAILTAITVVVFILLCLRLICGTKREAERSLERLKAEQRRKDVMSYQSRFWY